MSMSREGVRVDKECEKRRSERREGVRAEKERVERSASGKECEQRKECE